MRIAAFQAAGGVYYLLPTSAAQIEVHGPRAQQLNCRDIAAELLQSELENR